MSPPPPGKVGDGPAAERRVSAACNLPVNIPKSHIRDVLDLESGKFFLGEGGSDTF